MKRHVYEGCLPLIVCASLGCTPMHSVPNSPAAEPAASMLAPAPVPPVAQVFGKIPSAFAGNWLVVTHSKPVIDLSRIGSPAREQPASPPASDRVVNTLQALRITQSNGQWRVERLRLSISQTLADGLRAANVELVSFVPTAEQLHDAAASVATAAVEAREPKRIQLYTPEAPSPAFPRSSTPGTQMTLGFLYGETQAEIASGWSLNFTAMDRNSMSGHFESGSVGRDAHGLAFPMPISSIGRFDMYRMQ